jgi:hypothetical protein
MFRSITSGCARRSLAGISSAHGSKKTVRPVTVDTVTSDHEFQDGYVTYEQRPFVAILRFANTFACFKRCLDIGDTKSVESDLLI